MEAHNCAYEADSGFSVEISLGYITKPYLKSSMENNVDTGQ